MRELFFQVVPIILILLVFYAVLRVLFFTPLLKVIAEREARTIGAQKAAEAAQKAATEKIKQYQDALKQARTEIYLEQEAARKKALDERAARLKDARAKDRRDGWLGQGAHRERNFLLRIAKLNPVSPRLRRW